MTDYFALLNEPRRPWLDPEALKKKFLAFSASVHPDRVHNLSESQRTSAQEHYVALNAAHACLRDPKERLRHLLQLELGVVPQDIQRTPPELIDLFMEVGQLLRQADLLLTEKSKVSSPLLQVQFFERGQEQTDLLLGLQQRLNAKRDALVQSVRELDAIWELTKARGSTREETLRRLQSLLHLFGFYDRWLAQLNERITRLSF